MVIAEATDEAVLKFSDHSEKITKRDSNTLGAYL